MAEFTLQIISGAQTGRKIKIEGTLTLGRAAQSGVCFSGPDAASVSSQHAALKVRGGRLFIRDLGSTNGTTVNGEAVTESALDLNSIIGLGTNGPKLRVLDPSGAASGSGTSFRSTPPEAAKPGKFPGFPPAEAGNYTIGLAQRMTNDEADHGEIRELIKDKKRADRLVKAGVLDKREARMIEHAAHTYSAGKKRARVVLGAVAGAAMVVTGILLAQNLGYRSKLKQQENLLQNIHELESQLAETGAKSGAVSDQAADHEKAQLVARLRAAERQLVSVRGQIRSRDLVSTYKNPLGREIHTIMEGFGKKDYIVPDIFIAQVQKHINTFTKTSTRAILERSLANASRYQHLIENELANTGMPLAFFYLAMHESLLDPAITSSAGARGLWQLMPQTARDYGLDVPADWKTLPPEADQRTDPAASTHAGIKYVKTLYAEFGDVALAMAAYNAGEGRIRKALRAIDDPVNNRDFWYIYRMGDLAGETNEYVPKIIATIIVDKNRARYGFAP